jgi:tRNA pseudouridine13 synthase
MKTKRIFIQDHAEIKFQFIQNKYDFIVEELPLYELSNKGNFLILKIRKENLSTWNLIKTIAEKLGIEEHKIGYAGLKDKHATTTQYISIPLVKEKYIKTLNSPQIKVLSIQSHNKKLNIGDLKGNRFKITLKNVQKDDLPIIYQTLSKIQKHGVPNYFGYQRFGKDYNFDKSKAIAYGEEIMKNKKLENLLISAYQSYFFNDWLAHRVEQSKILNKNQITEIKGDVYSSENKITGLLPGRKVKRALNEARLIEEKFDDIFIHAKGFRREAWVTVKNLKNKYFESDKNLVLEFELPKGSYATVVIENIANINF